MSAHARTLLSHLHRLAAPAASDAVLLSRSREQRDEAAFAALMARHGPMVFGVCRRLLGDMQDAEDAFQATFLVLARKSASLRRPEALASFLYGIALRLARKARAAAARRPTAPIHRDTPEPIDPRPHPLDVLSGRELLALLDAEMARLPEVYRLPLLLCLLQGRTVEEAARQLGWSIGSLRGRLARGRERLRQRLMRRGLDLSVAAVTMLAPVVVPEKLLAASLRHLSGPVPAAISALAGGMMPALKLKIVGLVVVLVTAVGLGAGLSLRGTPEPQTPDAPSPAAPPPTQAKAEPRRDRYGDPLPEGAIARLGTLRFRVDAEIERLNVAPDGKTIAVRGNGGVWLLDAVSGKQIRRIDSSGSLNPGIAFSPDGRQLIAPCHVAEKDPVRQVVNFRQLVRVWETASGRKVKESELNGARWVGWSADGQALAAYVAKGEMRLRNVTTGGERPFAAKDLPQSTLCAVGKSLLAAFDEKAHVHVWDLASGAERCVLQAGGPYLHGLALSPDGLWLASLTQNNAGAYSVRLWDTARGVAVHRVAKEQKYLNEVAFSPDSKTLATVGSREVCLWDTATGRLLRRIASSGWSRQYVAFSPDGQTLATAARNSGASRAIHLWDVATGKRKPQPEGHSEWPDRLAFSPDGQRLATGGFGEGTIRVWNPATGEPLLRIQRQGTMHECAFSADGRTLLSCWDGKLLCFDAVTGRESHDLKIEDPDDPKARQSGLNLHLSDDRARLIVFSSGEGHREMLVTVWEVATRKQLIHRRRVDDSHWSVISADARMLAAPQVGAGGKGTIRGAGPMHLEDLATGERLLTFPRLEGQTLPLAFSPDGRLFLSDTLGPLPQASSGWGNTLRFWEVLTASELLTMPVPTNSGFIKAAFSPVGRLLALSAPSTEILLWDVRRGKELHRFKGFDGQVTSLAFSPDGRRLVSGLSDSTLLVWDVGASPAVRVKKLGAEELAKAWADLASKDAPRAFRARGILAYAPEEAIPLLTKHLHPARPADAQHLRKLLIALESDQFTVREKAQEELAKLGDLAESALRRTLENKPTLEVRRRVQALLERLRGPVTQPELLQALRAVAVLEDIGSPEARRLLEQLANGAPQARLTVEAKASLQRLERRRTDK